MIPPNAASVLASACIELQSGLGLQLPGSQPAGARYPTARLAKAFLLSRDGRDLAEEGVGFGAPILKLGTRTIFPGEVEVAQRSRGAQEEVTASFHLNLEERLSRRGSASVSAAGLYAVKNSLAALMRRSRPLRGLLTALSNGIRAATRWETVYEASDFSTWVRLTARIQRQAGTLSVELDSGHLPALGVTEVVVMNEQGARAFDLYTDSSGLSLRREQIGCWDRVRADSATFVSEDHRVAFTLGQAPGATLYRGWELAGNRLAWAGFGCSFSPALGKFHYQLGIGSLP